MAVDQWSGGDSGDCPTENDGDIFAKGNRTQRCSCLSSGGKGPTNIRDNRDE